MSKANNQFITGLVVGAAVAYLLTKKESAGGNGGILVAPKKDQKPPVTSIGAQEYNPFHYLPDDLGRQLPAIYAL